MYIIGLLDMTTALKSEPCVMALCFFGRLSFGTQSLILSETVTKIAEQKNLTLTC